MLQSYVSLGFTGSQNGLTSEQSSTLRSLLTPWASDPEGKSVHHGDCIGADAEFHDIIVSLSDVIAIKKYPCNITSKRAHCVGGHNVCEPLPPLDRNSPIVRAGGILIACPSSRKEVLRSGTWATIRRARKSFRDILYIYPDGLTEGDYNGYV